MKFTCFSFALSILALSPAAFAASTDIHFRFNPTGASARWEFALRYEAKNPSIFCKDNFVADPQPKVKRKRLNAVSSANGLIVSKMNVAEKLLGICSYTLKGIEIDGRSEGYESCNKPGRVPGNCVYDQGKLFSLDQLNQKDFDTHCEVAPTGWSDQYFYLKCTGLFQ